MAEHNAEDASAAVDELFDGAVRAVTNIDEGLEELPPACEHVQGFPPGEVAYFCAEHPKAGAFCDGCFAAHMGTHETKACAICHQADGREIEALGRSFKAVGGLHLRAPDGKRLAAFGPTTVTFFVHPRCRRRLGSVS